MSDVTETAGGDDNHGVDTIDELSRRLDPRIGAADVLASLAELAAESPPPELRARLLGAIAARPAPLAEPIAPVELYHSRAAAWSALLGQLDALALACTVAPYGWTVLELIAHVAVIEEYTARQFGLTNGDDRSTADPAHIGHLAYGQVQRAALVAGEPGQAIDRWRAAHSAIVEHARSERYDAARPVQLHEWPFQADTALIVRAFELWTHADDIRRAIGVELDRLAPGELRTMSRASVESLPLLLPLVSQRPLQSTRIVLTGPGGATFDLGDRAERANLLVADVVDYCRVVARRCPPAMLDATIEGDADLIGDLLLASQAIAL